MDICQEDIVLSHLKEGCIPAIGFDLTSDAVQMSIVIGRLRCNCININAVHLGSSHFGCKDGEQCRAAAHVHHDIVTDKVGIVQHRLHHHVGRFVVSGPERHFRAQADVVTGRWRRLVFSLLYRHLTVDDYRLESALPLHVPVVERHRECFKRCLERQSGEHGFQGLPVELRFLDIAFHHVVFRQERVIRQIGDHCLQNFRVLVREGINRHPHFYIIAAVHRLKI